MGLKQDIDTSIVFKSFVFMNLMYTSTQKKRYKDFFKYMFMLKPKHLFIIIYVNVCVKRVYLHKANNNIMFCYGKIPESQFSVP